MRTRRLVTAAFVALGIACSSVPDVSFQDGDAASLPGTGTADAAADGTTSAADASSGDAGGRPATDAATGCPSNPPNGGICCGSLSCIGCKASDCSSCQQKACSGSTVCCASGAGNAVACKPPQSC
jgi:hypothetical protein